MHRGHHQLHDPGIHDEGQPAGHAEQRELPHASVWSGVPEVGEHLHLTAATRDRVEH